jgi:polysaccharide export outer membrane protein
MKRRNLLKENENFEADSGRMRSFVFQPLSGISDKVFQVRQQLMPKGSRVLILLLLILFATATGPAASWAEQQTTATARGEYLLGAGDTIEVQVWKEEGLSRTLSVRLDGRISLPLIGEIDAAGKSPGELAAQIEKKYRHILSEPSVTVILSKSNDHYYVIGQVKQPGEFSLNAPLTVLQALARSGGFLEWAKTSNIELIRRKKGTEKLLTFDYDNLVNKGDLSQQILLAPGDTIIVP